jgi:ribosome maturation factor RimP
MDKTRPIDELIRPTVEALGYELVRVQLQGSQRVTLQVMAERADRRGMTVDDCARISRAISAVLDEVDPIDTEYVLEVSSPGIDRPLTRPTDYDRFISHAAKFELRSPVAGRKRFEAVIEARSGDRVTVGVEGDTFDIPLDVVKRARLVLTDRLIASMRSEEQDADAHGSAAGGDAA